MTVIHSTRPPEAGAYFDPGKRNGVQIPNSYPGIPQGARVATVQQS